VSERCLAYESVEKITVHCVYKHSSDDVHCVVYFCSFGCVILPCLLLHSDLLVVFKRNNKLSLWLAELRLGVLLDLGTVHKAAL
jgi:hypothetical protein